MRRRRQTKPRPHRDAAPPEQNRISERRQRSAGARHRRRHRSYLPTRAATASTTSPSAISRRRFSTATSRLRRKSAVSRSAARRRRSRPTSFDCRPTHAGNHVAGLPLGTRGGVSIPYTFAQDGEYEIQMWLARDLNGNVGGLREAPHARAGPPRRPRAGGDLHHSEARRRRHQLDKDLRCACAVRAGPHEIGVTFIRDGSSLIETPRQPLLARFNERRHPRTAPAIDQVSVTGPYGAKGAENTPSRRRLFVCQPEGQRTRTRKSSARGRLCPR